jgi:hypothetical protein
VVGLSYGGFGGGDHGWGWGWGPAPPRRRFIVQWALSVSEGDDLNEGEFWAPRVEPGRHEE